jgi:N-acetyl-alpha-D-muramate 1-phosphate uridylyltransferase
MQVAILAGGLATRLRPMTDSIPKSLIEIEGKPFIEYQLDILRQQGLYDVVLCVGYLGEKIEARVGDGNRLGIEVKYSHETDQLLGTAGALKKAESLLKEQFFVMYGDSYLFLDLASISAYLNRFDKLGIMTVYKNKDQFDRSNIMINGNLVQVYDKKHRLQGMDYIDYGAILLKRKCLDLVPDDRPFSLEELLTPLVRERQILAYKVKQRFYEIGSLNGITEFTNYIKESKVVQ